MLVLELSGLLITLENRTEEGLDVGIGDEATLNASVAVGLWLLYVR